MSRRRIDPLAFWIGIYAVLAGPAMLLPEILPATIRTAVVTGLVLTSFVASGVLARRWPEIRWGFWIVMGAILAGWLVTGPHEIGPIRHLGGVGLGALTMTVVGSACRTEKAVVMTARLFALAAAGVLLVGLCGTVVYDSKFVGGFDVVPKAVYFWMPRIKFGFPGLIDNGQINPNALGGTSMLLGPLCAGLAWAGFARRRYLDAGLGVFVTALALAAIAITRSRTAFLALAVTVVVFALSWRPARKWVFGMLAIVLGASVIRLSTLRETSSTTYSMGVRHVAASTDFRLSLWRDAAATVAAHPWLGVGINQFHQVTPNREIPDAYVAHAHNFFLQTALDAGVIGLAGYIVLIWGLMRVAGRTAQADGVVTMIAAGAAFSIVGVHLFGLADAIALGAKVGAFQWLAAGLVLAAATVEDSEAV